MGIQFAEGYLMVNDDLAHLIDQIDDILQGNLVMFYHCIRWICLILVRYGSR
ncbi:hypothetical protein D3C77_753470 [compost metagenome]